MRLKKGNTTTLQITVTDADGNLVTNLSTATAVKFMMKKSNKDPDSEAVVSKSLADGITVDDPSTGIVSVALTSSDLDITPQPYYAALQLEFGATINEIDLTEDSEDIDQIVIFQDIIEN